MRHLHTHTHICTVTGDISVVVRLTFRLALSAGKTTDLSGFMDGAATDHLWNCLDSIKHRFENVFDVFSHYKLKVAVKCT